MNRLGQNQYPNNRRLIYLVLATLFVTSTNLYAFVQRAEFNEKLNLNRLSKKEANLRYFGPEATAESTLGDPLGKKTKVQGEMLTIDTANVEVCEQIQSTLLDEVKIDSAEIASPYFCDSREGRYINVIRFDNNKNERPAIFSESNSLADKVQDFTILGVGAMAVIALLPPSISKWKNGTFDDPLKKWKKNATSTPTVDKDHWSINYIGHPVSGGVYYVVARNAGRSPMESFGFSAAMSTFFWEYGFEALAERPSIQDLLITPIIGSLFGEGMYQWGKYIEANGNKIVGSRFLGSIGLVLADPAGSLMRGINGLTRNRVVYSSKIDLGILPRSQTVKLDPYSKKSYEFGIRIFMKVNAL